MRRLLALRLTEAIVVLIGVLTITFFIARLRGDPAQLLAGPDATVADLAVLRKSLGLDRPLPDQYAAFVANAVRGQMGDSLRYRTPALPLVLERLPATALLALGAFVISVGVGVPLGIIAATRRNSVWDHTSMSLALLGQTVPAFWLGSLLILLFPLHLGLFYTSGFGTLGHLVLPAVTLGMFHTARLARLTRGGMLDVLSQDYVRTAKAKGVRAPAVVRRHALRNSLLPLISILGLEVGTLMGGSVVTETIFAWPGIGRLAVESVFARDYPVVQSVVLVASTVFVLTHLGVDLLYGLADPRIRYE
ncbi:MAG: ABC transporter permease [Armatimonadetes bacterium]|nr:ABC transporter permease [Armatimonadota bacterium]